MKVQIKISNGDKELCVAMDDIELVQTQSIIDVLHEFFINIGTVCNSEAMK